MKELGPRPPPVDTETVLAVHDIGGSRHRHHDVNFSPWSWATWTLLGPEVSIDKNNQTSGLG